MDRHGVMLAWGLCFTLVSAGVASAAEGDGSPGTLAEIVVTAQKREQSLQDVSLAVTAVDASRLRNNFVLSLEDVQFIAPSVSFGNSLGFAKVFIRGIGLDEQTPGIDPSVAVHLDGAVMLRACHGGQLRSVSWRIRIGRADNRTHQGASRRSREHT